MVRSFCFLIPHLLIDFLLIHFFLNLGCVADITGIAAADLVFDILLMMQMDSPPRVGHPGGPWDKNDVLLREM